MKIQGISTTSFGRALSYTEAKDYADTLAQAKQAIGQTGNSVLIVHDACLPQSPAKNTGVANLAGADSKNFFEFAKKYLGITGIEVLPQGQVYPHKSSYCAYSGSTLSLGNHEIDLHLLTTPEYEKILSPKMVQTVVASNNTYDKDTIVNWKNVIDNNSPQDKALMEAFKKFSQLPADSRLKKDFVQYCSANQDWLERKAIFQVLAHHYNTTAITRWEKEIDRNLFSAPEKTRERRIKELKQQYSAYDEFYRFKQFLADSHLQVGRKNLNASGLKLYGDFPIGFSHDEVWAFPNAFKKAHYMGLPEWNIPALNFDEILKEGSEANKLFKLKMELGARRYDLLRIDSAWNYITPIITPANETKILNKNRKHFGSRILDYLENYLKKLKGSNFSPKDLIYEFEAAPTEFSMWEHGILSPGVKDRIKILNTTYMKEKGSDSWGSGFAFSQKGLEPYSLGVGNHDAQPLRQIAENIPDVIITNGKKTEISHKSDAIEALAKEFNMSKTLLNNPIEFARAKWADIMQSKHIHLFYMDVFGRKERFNDHVGVDKTFFSAKIPVNYEETYIRSIQEGFGFNPMDAIEKIFKLKGLDKTQADLFRKIQKYNELLRAPGKPPITKNRLGKAMLLLGVGIASVAGGILYKNNIPTKEITPKESSPATTVYTA